MTQRSRIAFSGGFIDRGLALAEQRLAYLADLFDSGRWRRFHSESEFLENIRETRAAVETWRRLKAGDGGIIAAPVEEAPNIVPSAIDLADPVPVIADATGAVDARAVLAALRFSPAE